jgi:transcriptional regulator with XRE-family HTH domain
MAPSTDPRLTPEEEEVREILDFLRILARTLGFNDTQLARASHVPLSTYLRTLKGENDPKMSVVFAMVRALGLSVREFFELFYPEQEETSAARLQIERALGRVRSGRRPPKAAEKPERLISVDEIDRIFERLRAEVLQSVEGVRKAEASSPASARPPEDGRP